MVVAKRWTVDVFIGEHDGQTYAEARLHAENSTHLAATGKARLHPSDNDIPEIGDELAVARALSGLGHQLLVTATADIEAVCDRPVRAGR